MSHALAQSILAAAAQAGAPVRDRLIVRVRCARAGLFPAETTVARQVPYGWVAWSWTLGRDVLLPPSAVLCAGVAR